MPDVLNVAELYVGKPDQSLTTGAVQAAAPMTGMSNGAVTIDARTALDAAVWGNGAGYVSEDGVTLSQQRSTKDLPDWGKVAVRTLLDSWDGTIHFRMLSTSRLTMEWLAGEDNVAWTAATQTAGNQMKVGLGAALPPAHAWVFSMKDEDRRMRIYVPNGVVSEVGDTNFTASDGVMWDLTIKCNDDGTGHAIYILTDDGMLTA